jgi:16S rRNA (cytosine1402-N4)-methyltransferase
MITVHEPVLLREVLEYLNPQPNHNFIDCTIGGAGHAQAILAKTGPEGRLLGLDWDAEAIKRSVEILAKYSHRTILVNDNYINAKNIAYENQFYPITGILLDLGLSLDQLQSSGRGFSFQVDEPLDMRFSLGNDLTAGKILNHFSEKELIKIFQNYGEEPDASRLAKAIVQVRTKEPIKKTLQLVNLIIQTKKSDRRRKIHPATLVFQALRIAVNNELNNLKIALHDLLELLDSGGRCAVITFHSLEDRIVKNIFRQESKDCLCPPDVPKCVCRHQARVKLITKKPVVPTTEEISRNFRSRSAKLRVVEKL